MFKNKMPDNWYDRKDETIHLGVYGIVVQLSWRGNSITDDLHEEIVTDEDSPLWDGPEDQVYKQTFNSIIDGITATILGHACAGVDITSPAYIEGVESAINAAAEQTA